MTAMTTGGVVSGEGEGGRDEERGRGHRKMAVALSHILSSATEAERVSSWRERERESEREKDYTSVVSLQLLL